MEKQEGETKESARRHYKEKLEEKEKAVMTKHKWEEECPGRELLKKKKQASQNKKAY